MTLATLAARYCPSIQDSANDVLGRFNGSYQGGMGTVLTTAHGGSRAYEFDGANDGISIPYLLNTDGVADFPFSITLWVKSNNNASNCHFVGNYNDSSYGIAISQYMGTLYLGMQSRDGGYAALRRSVPSAFSNWTHIAMTYDGSSTADGIKVYLDGSLAASSAASPAVSGTYVKLGAIPEPFTIGRQGFSYFFDGYIDDVMVFDGVLDAADVAAIAAAPASWESDVIFRTSFENNDHGFDNVSNISSDPVWYPSGELNTMRDGIYGLSAAIDTGGADKTTSKTVTLSGSGVVNFWWKASNSEMDCDFRVDGASKESIPPTSWQFRTVPLTAGTHTLTWIASNSGALYPGTMSIDDVYVVLDPPEPVTLNIVGSTSVNLTKGLSGAFLIERSGGDITEPLTIDLSSGATSLATVPPTLTFLADESTAEIVVASVGNSGSVAITASFVEDAAEATLDVVIVTVPHVNLIFDAVTSRQTFPVRTAKLLLNTTVTRQTLRTSFRASSTTLIVRHAPGPRTDHVRLAWTPAVDVALYRSWIAVQIKMDRPNYDPTVSAIGADSGRIVPVVVRGFDAQVLKVLIQPHKSLTDPEDIILEITDYA